MATAIGVLPNVNRVDAAKILAAGLDQCGYQERARILHRGDTVFPELAEALEQHPGAESITWFSRTLEEDGVSATIFHHRYEPPQRWDPKLARALSHACGGFTTAVELNRSADEYGLVVFFDGHTIELIGCDSVRGLIQIGRQGANALTQRELCDDEFMYGTFERYFREITGGAPAELRLRGDAVFESWIVDRASNRADPYPLEAENQSQVRTWFALANTAEGVWREALMAGAGDATGWSWTARETPVAAIPYILMRRNGALDERFARDLAKLCDCFMLGIELRPPGESFRWIAFEPGSDARHGENWGAAAFIQRWAAFAVSMGESPGIICWPEASEATTA
jgi:hypothetical protein